MECAEKLENVIFELLDPKKPCFDTKLEFLNSLVTEKNAHNDRKSAILKMASHMSLPHFQHVYPRKYTCRPTLDHRSTVKFREPQNFYGSIGWVLDLTLGDFTRLEKS